jgi:hypothetical protein
VTVSTGVAIGAVVLDTVTGLSYCMKLARGKAQPRIATWLIFEIGVGMSLATYFASRDHSLLKAALNLTDAATVTTIIAVLLFIGRGTKLRFTRNEQLSLLLSLITLVLWGITHSDWLGFIGFQIVMSVAYVPTVESLWHWRPGPAPEPATTWFINAAAALLGILVDITGPHHDYLAMLYPLRAFMLCLLVVILVQRWKHLNAQKLR